MIILIPIIKTPIDRVRAIIRIRPLITDTQTNTLDWYWLLLHFAALGKAEPLISTAARPKFDLDLWPWPMTLTPTLKQGNSDVKTRFLAFDLDLWPTTLTYLPNLAKVKVNLCTKYQTVQPWEQIDRRTGAAKYIISLNLWSIIITHLWFRTTQSI